MHMFAQLNILGRNSQFLAVLENMLPPFDIAHRHLVIDRNFAERYHTAFLITIPVCNLVPHMDGLQYHGHIIVFFNN